MKDEFGYSNKEDARAHQQDLEEERRESQRRNKRSNSESYAHTQHYTTPSSLHSLLLIGLEGRKRKRGKKWIGARSLSVSIISTIH